MSIFGLLDAKAFRNSIDLRSPRDPNEIKMMKEVNQLILEVNYLKHGITIKLGNYVFDRVVGMNANFSGDPKADVALIGFVNNKLAEVAFISYKKGGDAKAFQQYSGLTDKAGTSISRNPIVLEFLKKAGEHIKSHNKSNSAKPGIPAAFQYVPQTSDGEQLVRRSVFGPDYSKISESGNGGNKQNVHVIAQGKPTLTKVKEIYELSFSEHVYSNNDSIDWAFEKESDYRAVLAGTFRNERGFDVLTDAGPVGFAVQTDAGPVRYDNFRVGLYPYILVKTRKEAQEFK